MSEDKPRCIAEVSDLGGLLFNCPNPAKYGKFCGVHCPEKKAAREAKRGPSQWEREIADRKRYDDALDAVLAASREIASNGPVPWRPKLSAALKAFDAVTSGSSFGRSAR